MKKRMLVVFALLGSLLLAVAAFAVPVPGTYHSTDLGGQLLTGRASTWRTGINSGLPHVLHAQSWDGSALGTQWTVDCPVETDPFTVQDYRDANGTGTVVYTSIFNGGTFTLLSGSWPWGDGTGTLGTSTMISTVQFVNWIPVSSVVNGNLSGQFDTGETLTFAIANGVGVGETTDLDPSITKPADYPEFLDDSCGPAPSDQQFGSWGTVISITMRIDAAVGDDASTWSGVKALYR